MKQFKDMNAEQVGHALQGFGINLLVKNVHRSFEFLHAVFEFESLQLSKDYGLLEFRKDLYQLHGDHTYGSNPLLGLLPENGARGAGIELRLFEVDPDQSEQRARQGGYTILQETAGKPHGLRECFILDPDGYCWVPSVRA